jgi:biopolymer transport protein ExbD
MKNRNYQTQENTEINITPMLDVVFIMLIFFIVTTTFNKETGLAIFNSTPSSIETIKVKTAIIKLDAQNNQSVNGVATTLNGIKSLLANLKSSNPDITVQIISSKEVKTGDLVNVIQQIKINDIIKYSVSSY